MWTSNFSLVNLKKDCTVSSGGSSNVKHVLSNAAQLFCSTNNCSSMWPTQRIEMAHILLAVFQRLVVKDRQVDVLS